MTTNRERSSFLTLLLVLIAVSAISARCGQPGALGTATPSRLIVQSDDALSVLSLRNGLTFHRTPNQVVDDGEITFSNSPVRLAVWTEIEPGGKVLPFYAISLDGQSTAVVRPTSYVLKLRHGDFDPGVRVPPVEPSLDGTGLTNLYIVQFVTQPLEEFRTEIAALGGTVYQFLANHAHIVKMDPQVRQQVAALPYVRWVGPYHPAYRLEESIRATLAQAPKAHPKQRYNVQVFEPGPAQKRLVADRIEALGGTIDLVDAGKFLLEATLTPEQLSEVASWDEVLYLDPWSPYETDMDIVREIGGANYIEGVAGYTGEGVRAETFDAGFQLGHVDLQSPALIEHGGAVGIHNHGTAVAGILFGDGVNCPLGLTQERLLADGQGIVADYNNIGLTGTSRYTHTGELVQAPWNAVFQTASVGSARTFFYTTISADTDAMLFDFDIVHCQSQSNAGNQDSRPQAWAKNIVSGGAVNHYNTPTRSDDCWCGGASIGPASDGRIKPDLSFFYDATYTTYTTSTTGCGTFGGTSGATPSICGHFGLFFDMWSDGIFGNEVDPGGTVFDNRPHMTTAKAAMINTASPWPFSGTTHDMTRVHQGWGLPDLQYLYDIRDNISFVDETHLLANMESVDYIVLVQPGEPQLRVTLTYADPPGVPSSSQHRINDLTLKVTSPSATVYWGNNGLLASEWSTPDGSPNTIDTVENVFVESPESGDWTVEVIASEVNQDGHVETPELDADFALVATPPIQECSSAGRITLDRPEYTCEDVAAVRVVDCDLNTHQAVIETVDVTADSTTEPGGETVVLTETGPATADFRGTIALSTTNSSGVLQVAEGDTVTATYIDADDGQGGINVVVTDSATVDCTAPVISNVQTTNIQAHSATVTFDTDEPANGAVDCGTSCGALAECAAEGGYVTAHSLNLSGLTTNTTYYYAVDAADEAGNSSTDDNGGACYTFDTPDVPDYFTELFTGDFDLDGLSLTFIPDGSPDFYSGCVEPIASLPVDPSGGAALPLSDDDYEMVTQVVSLYGTDYSQFYVGSNGYITFTAGDTDYTESLTDHFEQPRISALFDDLNPSSGGTVSWKLLADRVVVTWEDVPQYGSSDSNTFQVEMHFNGTIVISFLGIGAADGLVGLSEGFGVPPGFIESDLSAMGPCLCLGDDTDGDGILDDGDCSGIVGDYPCPHAVTTDCDDNCTFRWNPDQSDVSGDGVGDVCQCADMNGDGLIDGADLTLYRRYFGGLPSPFSLDRCGVSPAPDGGACDGADLTVILRSFGGLSPGITNTCSAYMGP